MNQEIWKGLVEREASSIKWHYLALVVAGAMALLMVVSVATGWGDKGLIALVMVIFLGIGLVERRLHRNTVRTLEELAREATARGGIEA